MDKVVNFKDLYKIKVEHNLLRIKLRDIVFDWQKKMEVKYNIPWHKMNFYLDNDDILRIQCVEKIYVDIIEDTIKRFDLIVIQVKQEYQSFDEVVMHPIYTLSLRHREYLEEEGLIDWRGRFK